MAAGIPIDAPENVSDTSNCQLKDHHIILKGPDPMGPITFASITLEGHIRPLLYENSQLIAWPPAEISESNELKYPSFVLA